MYVEMTDSVGTGRGHLAAHGAEELLGAVLLRALHDHLQSKVLRTGVLGNFFNMHIGGGIHIRRNYFHKYIYYNVKIVK